MRLSGLFSLLCFLLNFYITTSTRNCTQWDDHEQKCLSQQEQKQCYWCSITHHCLSHIQSPLCPEVHICYIEPEVTCTMFTDCAWCVITEIQSMCVPKFYPLHRCLNVVALTNKTKRKI